MDDPHIRKARPDDVEALVACIDAAYAHYADRISDLPPVSDGCAQDIAENRVWVAVEGDEIVGCLFLVPGDGFLTLTNVAVHPDHRGKGLGRVLMAFCEDEARRQGFTEMRLNTHAAMPENVRLYAHLGWVETARDGNTVSMRKRL